MQEHTKSQYVTLPRSSVVEVQVDFEQTIVNEVIDQWSKQAFIKAQ